MNKQLLKESINNKDNLILYFTKQGCYHCNNILPVIEEIKQSKPNYIYHKLNHEDDETKLIESFCNVDCFPTLIIINEGKYQKFIGSKNIKNII